MKIRGVKKLAAIAAGAALVGTALAPIATAAVNLTKGDVFDLTTGSPNVNIVVGSKAAITDAQWAGNIAAAIAKKATTTGTVDTTAVSGTWGTPSELAAKLVVGGTTVTYSGAKTIKADLNSAGIEYAASGTTSGGPNVSPITPFDGAFAGGSPPSQTTYTNSTLTNLINKSYSEKVNGSTSSLTVKEEVILDTDSSPKFDSQAAIGDLILELPAGSSSLTAGFIYRVNLGSGLSTIDTNYTDDGSADDVKLPWMGRDFTVRTISATQVELIQQQSEKTYTVGTGDNIITGLEGKGSQAGKELTLEFVQAATDSTVQAQVKDDNGTAIGNPQWLSAGDAAQDIMADASGNAVLDTGVYISTGGIKNVGSTTDPDYRVTALVGTDRVLLVDDKGYPYDSSATSYDWKVNLTFNSSNDLTSIEVYNDRITKIGTSAMKAGDKLDLTSDKIATLEFKGLETDEVVSTMSLAKSLASDDSKFYHSEVGSVLTFTDNDSVLHKVPLYFKARRDSCSTVKVDGKEFAIKVVATSSSADMNFIVRNGDVVNGYAWNFDTNAGSEGTILNTNFKAAGTLTDTNIFTEGGTFDVNGVTYTLQDANASHILGPTSTAVSMIISPSGGGYITLVDNTSTCFDRSSYLDNTATYVPGGSGFIWGGGAASGATANYPNSAAQPSTPSTVDSNTEGVYFYDDKVMQNPQSASGNVTPAVRFPGSEGSLAAGATYFTYVPYVDESKSYAYFLLTGQSFEGSSQVYHNKGWRFNGTDVDDGTFKSGVPDVNFYLPDITDFDGHPLKSSSSTSSDFNFFTAVFYFDEDEDYDWDVNAYVDTTTGKLLVYNAQRTEPTYEASYSLDRATLATAVSWGLRDDISGYIKWGYTDFGSKAAIADDTLTLTMPENRPQVYAVVTGASTTTEITGGEELTVTEGEQGTTATGTKVTVSDITFTDGTCTGTAEGEEGEAVTYTKVAPDNGKPQILLDDSTPQNAVLVGGHFVNRLSAQVSAVADTLKASGDKMEVKPYTGPNGEKWVIVAGYTASDTVSAANELIDWLENLA